MIAIKTKNDMDIIEYFDKKYPDYSIHDCLNCADPVSLRELADEYADYKHSFLSNVSVSHLIVERRQYILDEIWSCKETDLTDDEVDTLDEKMDRDMSVLQWFYSR